MAGHFQWYGEHVLRQTVDNVAEALGEIAFEAELGAKHHIQPGHGVDTGSLKRSIHCAPPGYNWRADHSYPNGPERGGKIVKAEPMPNGKLWVRVGSGQRYSIWVYLKYYRFMEAGRLRARLMTGSILHRHRLR